MHTEETDPIACLLADEAYIAICCRTLQDRMDELTRRREDLHRTRPPFGLFMTPARKQQFDESSRQQEEAEGAERQQLVKAQAVSQRIEQTLRIELQEFLDRTSPDFGRRNKLLSQLGIAEARIATYLDCLRALAREAATAREAIAHPPPRHRRTLRDRSLLGDLLAAAHRADTVGADLLAIAAGVAELGGPLFGEVALHLPELDSYEAWAHALEYLERPAVAKELAAKEDAVRMLLLDDGAALRSTCQSARDSVRRLAREYLEAYWHQLRDFALQNYVRDVNLDDMLDELTHRYLRGEEPYVGVTSNPYYCER